MGLRDRFTRAEWAVLLGCLTLQAVNTTVGYHLLSWLGVPDELLIPLVVLAGGVFVLPILGVVVFSRPTEGWSVSEYRYSVSDFDNEK